MNVFYRAILCIVMISLMYSCEKDSLESSVSSIEESKISDQKSQSFNVKIDLVDYYSGEPTNANGIRGYFATNTVTGEVFYPDRSEDDNRFFDLAKGTYRFDAEDGYFCGVVSKTVTLTDNQVGNDGFITIVLGKWCE